MPAPIIAALGAGLGAGAGAGAGGMTPFISQLAMQSAGQTAQGGLGALMGLALQGGQDRRQIRQAEKLQNLQVVGQKHMMDYGYEKQLQMWKDTNYGAQVEQMKLAGLNPGLLYGMSGGGGSTTGQAQGNVGTQQAPHGGGEAVTMAQTVMGLGLQRAQMQNIQADTKLKEVTATKTGGIDTKVVEQELINKEAQEKLTRMNTVWQELQNSIARQTIKDAMKIIENTVTKQEQEIQAMKLQNQLNEAQMNDRIKMMKYQAIGAALENVKTNAQTENINQDTVNKIQEVSNSIKQLILKGIEVSADASYKQTLESQIRGIYDEVPNPVKDILDKLLFIIPGGKGAHKPVTGFTPGGRN